MQKNAIILAGGFGTRLQTIVSDLPKPMAPVNGEPFLNYQLRYLKHFGIKKVILSVGHLAEKIQDHYGTFFNGLEISYAIETTPLGTGGGIRLALEHCTDKDPLVLNGDSFFDIDLRHFSDRHRIEASQISLALRKVKDAARYGTIETDTDNRIISFREKNRLPGPGLINGGIYILNRELYLAVTPDRTMFSIEKDLFEKYLSKFVIKGFEFEGYFIDIGIPEDYAKAQHDLKGFTHR